MSCVWLLSVMAEVTSPASPPKSFVPHNVADVTALVNQAVDVLWPSRYDTKSWESLQPEAASSENSVARSQAAYQRLVYDMTAQVIATLCDEATASSDTLHPRRPWQLTVASALPQLASEAKPQIASSVLKHLGLESSQPPLLPRYSGQVRGQRSGDQVDRVLAAELVKEESAWTDFTDEELFVKCQVADMLLNMMISNTVDTLSSVTARKRQQRNWCSLQCSHKMKTKMPVISQNQWESLVIVFVEISLWVYIV